MIAARHHPLRVYALLELGIAAFGILAASGLTGFVVRGEIGDPHHLGGDIVSMGTALKKSAQGGAVQNIGTLTNEVV